MNNYTVIPVSVVIPTANRAAVLTKTLESIAAQYFQPYEIFIIDASEGMETKQLCEKYAGKLSSKLHYYQATAKGAAVQRTQGVKLSTQEFIYFMDDDILLDPGCIEKTWKCIESQPEAGAACALVINQQYHTPGRASRMMYRLMSGKKLETYAGKCIGPAWNLLPQDSGSLVNEVEWVYTTCTIYRKKALPEPLFPSWFIGYSLMEDLALSLIVAKKWKLYNVREAKIFHDSQPGAHKDSVFRLSRMELMNRHYIMIKVLGRKGFINHLKLFLFELWGLYPRFMSISGLKKLLSDIAGKIAASYLLLFKRK